MALHDFESNRFIQKWEFSSGNGHSKGNKKGLGIVWLSLEERQVRVSKLSSVTASSL